MSSYKIFLIILEVVSLMSCILFSYSKIVFLDNEISNEDWNVIIYMLIILLTVFVDICHID